MSRQDAPSGLSVVVPMFNAERQIATSLAAIADYLAARPGTHEIVVVDDGSSDRSVELARAAHLPEGVACEVLANAVNRGKGFSVRRGLAVARGRHVLFTDADLAYPVDNFDRVLEALEAHADVAIASRVHPESRYVTSPRFFRRIYTRHTLGRAFNGLTRLLLVPGVHDTQAGLKGFRRSALAALLPRLTLDRFSFDVELLVVARELGLALAEVPVTFEYRNEPSTLELGRDSARMLTDLLRVHARRRRGGYRP
ncbi:MAG: dolichyl-phosphate beta-glucosyltransferase [Polyangiaceae bacterium]